jgi:hypothetical protein
MVVLPSQQRYAASTPPTYHSTTRKPSIHQVSRDSPRASSRAVGRESASPAHGRHAAVARKRWACCSALQSRELLKCRPAHTRRRLLDSTFCSTLRRCPVGRELGDQRPPTDCRRANNGYSVAGRTASCTARLPPMPGCLWCSCRGDRPDGWVQNRLSRAPPITECLFERRVSHHVPTVWLLASRPTVLLFIRSLLD